MVSISTRLRLNRIFKKTTDDEKTSLRERVYANYVPDQNQTIATCLRKAHEAHQGENAVMALII